MILADVAENAIVAGESAGAGAEDVVRVRDVAERDLSRNSIMACKEVSDRTLMGDVKTYFGFGDGSVSTFDVFG